MSTDSNDNGLWGKVQAPSPVPIIINNNRQLREITVDCLEALYKARPKPIYNRKGILVTIESEDGQPYIEIINESMMRGYLAKCADFIRINSDREIETFPLPEVVKNILSLRSWRFPKLLGVIETPVIRPDGTIVTYSGYDEATKLYYHPGHLLLPHIPDKPSRNQLKRAISLVLEPFTDFPFTDGASKANTIAILLTLCLRPLFTGRVPLPLFDKPQQGTGASLITDIISIISSGKPAPMISPPRNEEEWKKTILSVLIKGQSICVIDNLETILQSESLSTAISQINYEGRKLQVSEVLTLPSVTIWMATGNNIRLGGDLSRRSIWIRMDARVPQPWLREVDKYKHPDLRQWVTEKRGDIIGAILTIGRAWVLAGKPKAPFDSRLTDTTGKSELVKPTILGGFEDWSRVLGDILAFIGVNGFLDNLQSMYSQMDAEGPAWATFLSALYGIIGDNPTTTAELIALLDGNAELSSQLPITRDENKDFARTLGTTLSKKQDVRYTNGLMLQNAGKKHKVIKWQVVEYTKTDKPQSNPHFLASTGGSGGSETAEAAKRNTASDEIKPQKNIQVDKLQPINNPAIAAGIGPDNPLNPLTPTDDDEDDDDSELSYADIDEINWELMKFWPISELDLLRENEFTFINPFNSEAAAIKIPDDAKWLGICDKCGLTWARPQPFDIRKQTYVQCPKCGDDDIYWHVDKREVISSAALRTRAPEYIERELKRGIKNGTK